MADGDLMNSDGTLGHGAGSAVSVGTFVITSSPNTKVKAGPGDGNRKEVYFGQVDFTFSGGNASGCDPGTVTGAGSVLAESTKNFDGSSNAVMREGDETVTGAFAGTSGGSPVTIGDQPVKVDNAGQTKVNGV